jgi:sec-independent protein translocase protein TatA
VAFLPHLIILALVVLILFGRGRISEMMGDFGKGIKSFKEGMADENNRQVPPPQQISRTRRPSRPGSACTGARSACGPERSPEPGFLGNDVGNHRRGLSRSGSDIPGLFLDHARLNHV